ncbi:hypothetical protein Pcinc_030481 [Petrolisthes cinctipes]|uniref:Uncharacterized protein n=1 Tax=Petrolisthes cinctipes TaxID=88211 RepID=A0AAE1K601_PETCI|nr:hypothetical protein Pcinc_030481 [Petrolisthes cinctipes]
MGKEVREMDVGGKEGRRKGCTVKREREREWASPTPLLHLRPHQHYYHTSGLTNTTTYTSGLTHTTTTPQALPTPHYILSSTTHTTTTPQALPTPHYILSGTTHTTLPHLRPHHPHHYHTLGLTHTTLPHLRPHPHHTTTPQASPPTPYILSGTTHTTTTSPASPLTPYIPSGTTHTTTNRVNKHLHHDLPYDLPYTLYRHLHDLPYTLDRHLHHDLPYTIDRHLHHLPYTIDRHLHHLPYTHYTHLHHDLPYPENVAILKGDHHEHKSGPCKTNPLQERRNKSLAPTSAPITHSPPAIKERRYEPRFL